jgi:hypothetical protein
VKVNIAEMLKSSLGIDRDKAGVIEYEFVQAIEALCGAIVAARKEATPRAGKEYDGACESVARGVISDAIGRCVRVFGLRQFGVAYVDPVSNEFVRWCMDQFPDTDEGHAAMALGIAEYNRRQTAENPETLTLATFLIGPNNEPIEND